jgi:hypothetical protein
MASSKHPYLEDIVPRAHICDIHPLAINVMPIGIPAAYSHSLFPEVGTCIAPLQSCKGKLVTEAPNRQLCIYFNIRSSHQLCQLSTLRPSS